MCTNKQTLLLSGKVEKSLQLLNFSSLVLTSKHFILSSLSSPWLQPFISIIQAEVRSLFAGVISSHDTHYVIKAWMCKIISFIYLFNCIFIVLLLFLSCIYFLFFIVNITSQTIWHFHEIKPPFDLFYL